MSAEYAALQTGGDSNPAAARFRNFSAPYTHLVISRLTTAQNVKELRGLCCCLPAADVTSVCAYSGATRLATGSPLPPNCYAICRPLRVFLSRFRRTASFARRVAEITRRTAKITGRTKRFY